MQSVYVYSLAQSVNTKMNPDKTIVNNVPVVLSVMLAVPQVANHVSVVLSVIMVGRSVTHVPLVLSVLLVPPVVHLMRQVVLLVLMPVVLQRVILVVVGNTTIKRVKHQIPVAKMIAVLDRTLLQVKLHAPSVPRGSIKI